MSRINRVPYGLQELLGSTAQGDNPSELLQEVRPAFDIEPYWHADRVVSTDGSVAAIGIGAGLAFTVPAGEYWVPIMLSGQYAMLAADVCGFSLTVRTLPASTTVFIASSGVITAAVDTNLHVSHDFVKSTLWRAGTRFGAQLQATNGASRTLTIQLHHLVFLA